MTSNTKLKAVHLTDIMKFLYLYRKVLKSKWNYII